MPFRLTPNMMDALGLSGYEGVFRRCSEVAMEVLRARKDTVLSVLEPFIHDPLVEWKKSGGAGGAPGGAGGAPGGGALGGKGGGGGGAGGSIASTAEGAETENHEGVRTVRRIGERLDGYYNAGTDWLARLKSSSSAAVAASAASAAAGGARGAKPPAAALAPMMALEVKGQVHRLLKEATSDANLLQMYVGWFPMVRVCGVCVCVCVCVCAGRVCALQSAAQWAERLCARLLAPSLTLSLPHPPAQM